MLTIATQTRTFITLQATDMRKGFDGLSGLVSDTLKQDPLSGERFLVVNRRRDRMKVLYWDGDGLAIWNRRLEQGTFKSPLPMTNSMPSRSGATSSRCCCAISILVVSNAESDSNRQADSQSFRLRKHPKCSCCSVMIRKSVFYINSLFLREPF